MSTTPDPFADAFGHARGRGSDRQGQAWPDDDRLALVWERGLQPQRLRNELRDGAFSFVDRVTLLPEGVADPSASFYFMELGPFVDGFGYIVECGRGRRLWVAGTLGSGLDDERPDEDWNKPVATIGYDPPSAYSPAAAATCDAIAVWRYEHTSKRWRELVNQGGDEDWVAFVPEHLAHQGYEPSWLDEGRSFGCCTVEIAAVEGGALHIGCHA